MACALKLFRDELDDGMSLTGLTDISKVAADVVKAEPAL